MKLKLPVCDGTSEKKRKKIVLLDIKHERDGFATFSLKWEESKRRQSSLKQNVYFIYN